MEMEVSESNDDALGINSLPDEMIEEIFSHLTQNKLGQFARVCRKWNILTKSPYLWKKVDVKLFCSSDRENSTVVKSFISGLSSCVTVIRLDLSECQDLDFKELCLTLHEKCPNVEKLILVCCNISTSLPEVINFCTQFLQGLKKLVFYYCEFLDHSKTVELNDNSKIEVLDLHSCEISHFSKTQLSKLIYLKELRSYFTNLDDAWFVDDTSFWHQLHVLNLGYTDITARTFLAIQRHGHNLKELYLCDLNLKEHVISVNFSNSVFPHLKTICLGRTYVTWEDVVSLIQSCPSLSDVYVNDDVALSFAIHPFVAAASRYKSRIVKAISLSHNHNVDHLHN